MDVILLFNGLGNQMSQYAFYLSKKKISGARFIFEKKSRNRHNGYELEKVFGIKEPTSASHKILYLLFLAISYQKFRIISQPVIRMLGLLGFGVINEDNNYAFQPNLMKPANGLKFYVGGWHSEKYFGEIKDTIRETFSFDQGNIGIANLEVLQTIRNCTSVSVHVRRGDFLNEQNYQKYGSVCTLNYFLCAIAKMKSLVEQAHFFFFTNDYLWVKDNFIGDDFTIININSGADSWKDMFLISQCEHNISSNGSFSWWASYLNMNKNKKVIVPKNFMANTYFEDFYPEDWILLSDY